MARSPVSTPSLAVVLLTLPAVTSGAEQGETCAPSTSRPCCGRRSTSATPTPTPTRSGCAARDPRQRRARRAHVHALPGPVLLALGGGRWHNITQGADSGWVAGSATRATGPARRGGWSFRFAPAADGTPHRLRGVVGRSVGAQGQRDRAPGGAQAHRQVGAVHRAGLARHGGLVIPGSGSASRRRRTRSARAARSGPAGRARAPRRGSGRIPRLTPWRGCARWRRSRGAWGRPQRRMPARSAVAPLCCSSRALRREEAVIPGVAWTVIESAIEVGLRGG